MTETLDTRRKRMVYQSWHRGNRETDIILGKFAESNLDRFTSDQLDQFDALLDLDDHDLYFWYSGQGEPDNSVRTPVLDMFLNFKLVK